MCNVGGVKIKILISMKEMSFLKFILLQLCDCTKISKLQLRLYMFLF